MGRRGQVVGEAEGGEVTQIVLGLALGLLVAIMFLECLHLVEVWVRGRQRSRRRVNG